MQRSKPSRLLVALAGAAAIAFALGGCASSSAGSPGKKGGTEQVLVTLRSDGSNDTCALDRSSLPAGPVTFTVKNTNSTAITEIELQSDQRILGEKENLVPGLAPVSFTVTLDGGRYQLVCPGAKTEVQTVTVTGTAKRTPSGSVQSVLKQGTAGYAKYVDGVVDSLVTAVGNLKTAVDAGSVERAKAEYALARPFYERIESDVAGFTLPGYKATDNRGNLDYLVDMRQSNLDNTVGWHGFHAIERDLWQNGAITDSTKQLAAELQTDVGKLQTLVKKLDYRPEDLANGAAGLLEEVQSKKIKGDEEAFSHLDLVDFAANVEGAGQAFAFLKPGLMKIDPALTSTVQKQFDRVLSMLDGYRDPSAPGGYRTYTPELRAADANTLSQTVQALQDPLSRIAEKVATAN